MGDPAIQPVAGPVIKTWVCPLPVMLYLFVVIGIVLAIVLHLVAMTYQ